MAFLPARFLSVSNALGWITLGWIGQNGGVRFRPFYSFFKELYPILCRLLDAFSTSFSALRLSSLVKPTEAPESAHGRKAKNRMILSMVMIWMVVILMMIVMVIIVLAGIVPSSWIRATNASSVCSCVHLHEVRSAGRVAQWKLTTVCHAVASNIFGDWQDRVVRTRRRFFLSRWWFSHNAFTATTQEDYLTNNK